MKPTALFFIIFTFIVSFCYSQNKQKEIQYINKIEGHLLNSQRDSVLILLPKVSSTNYTQLLARIANNDNPSYKDYLKFVTSVSEKQGIRFEDVSDFINQKIPYPPNSEKINYGFVKLKWFQISELRDEVSIESASEEQENLENYVAKFNEEDYEVKKAKILISTHQLVLYEIQNEIKKGKQRCLKNIEFAKQNNETELAIIFLYHLCDYLIKERDLDGYIKVSEESLALEKQLPEKSIYYVKTLQHLLDAYIYKGENAPRINSLLKELSNDIAARKYSFALYMKLLGTLEKGSDIEKNILKKFEVNNVLELASKFEILGKEELNPNDYFFLIEETTNALLNYKYYEEAASYSKEGVALTRKIYAEDLSNTLANYKTKQAVKEKDIQIKAEKEQKTLYLIISSLVIGLLLVTVLLLFRLRKQSKVLELKNNQINKTLKEKELLVREVHHRVKNNFQIVASLLELQSKGIEDEKALALANEGKNRVKSMALIHQKLYQTEDGRINFDEYIKLLIKEISALFASDKKIETTINSKNMSFDVDTAIPLGLIVNELITNAYKYAFTEKDKRYKLDVSITKENDFYKLVVSDNGKGLNEAIDVKKIKSLGLRLVSRLTRQLQGKFEIKNQEGASFIILFKDARSRKEID